MNCLYELKKYIGGTVRIQGMIYKIRRMSGFAFILLRVRDGLLQCVHAEEFSGVLLSELKEGMGVVISGQVIEEPRSREGFEVRMIDCRIVSKPHCEEPPVVVNGKSVAATLDTLLDYRPLTLRNERERAIFRIQAGICEGFREFFRKNGFTEIHSPKIVFSGAEGGSNIFRLDYFGREAYLAQSPQFYKQMMVPVFERVYEIGPVFRAEKHDTSRHINEYTSVDMEMGFIESFHDLMRLETKMITEAFCCLQNTCAAELELLRVSVPELSEIPALSFSEAKELVSKVIGREITDTEDFEPQEEKLLCEIMKKQTGCDFVFVTHYKASKRPFYAMDSAENPEVTESFDLLFRGMEITTGGQRIHDYGEQVRKMEERGMKVEAFSGYLMAHKYGLPPHGGLGLGLERFTAKLLGFDNVRRATLFPRDINRLEP